MTAAPVTPLHQQIYSLQHDRFADLLVQTENLLIIQDLDGVCMALINDPLDRHIDPAYVAATSAFDGHFYVLTNGEHTGQRGVNGIIERTLNRGSRQAQGHYLPGLAAGGVQWQTRQGEVSHPGVSEAELAFLRAVPDRIRASLVAFAQDHALPLDDVKLERCIQASALDNVASPTANLNTFHRVLVGERDRFADLQRTMAELMDTLLMEAHEQGLVDAFFVHYAPNHGRGEDGKERIWLAQGEESGTTDFQFMLRGAIKEAGVLALLNRYYAQRTGTYPLGPDFSVRQAPQTQADLLALVKHHFDPALMPLIVGVGDTVTSQVVVEDGIPVAKRGGSDRNFLQLIQAIDTVFERGNVVVYVDSSGGELKNRRPLAIEERQGVKTVVAGPGDPQDTTDPLRLNVVFPGGHRQYCQVFQQAAQTRSGE